MDLVYEGMKYCVRATQTGKSNYMMELGHSKKDVEACILYNYLKGSFERAGTPREVRPAGITWILRNKTKRQRRLVGEVPATLWLPKVYRGGPDICMYRYIAHKSNMCGII